MLLLKDARSTRLPLKPSYGHPSDLWVMHCACQFRVGLSVDSLASLGFKLLVLQILFLLAFALKIGTDHRCVLAQLCCLMSPL